MIYVLYWMNVSEYNIVLDECECIYCMVSNCVACLWSNTCLLDECEWFLFELIISSPQALTISHPNPQIMTSLPLIVHVPIQYPSIYSSIYCIIIWLKHVLFPIHSFTQIYDFFWTYTQFYDLLCTLTLKELCHYYWYCKEIVALICEQWHV